MQNREMIRRKDDNTVVKTFFEGNENLISLYICVQEEMLRCDPDLLFCCRNGIIGLAKKEEKYRFYLAPSEDGYDIKFAHLDVKLPFLPENEKRFLEECEKCVLYILQNPYCVRNEYYEDSEIEDSTAGTVLNKNQRRFCKSSSQKNIRLLAPAGSGKTFSLLWRCKYIVDDYKKKGKVPPYFLILNTWQLFSPNTFSISFLYSATVSFFRNT